jgi:serine/threonine protein kinase
MDDVLEVGKYTLIKPLGQGRFGNVYIAQEKNDKTYCALKLEDMDSEFNTIQHEAFILHKLFKNKVSDIPSLYWYSTDDPWRFLTTTLYQGDCLQTMYDTITWEDVTHWFESAVNIVQSIHKAEIVHRDIKPKHFIQESNKSWKLIDFGLAGLLDTGLDAQPGQTIFGTPKYMSIWIHQGYTPTRRDDMITLVYIFIDLYMRCHHHIRLPWLQPNAYDHELKTPSEHNRIHIQHPYNKALKHCKDWDCFIAWLKKYQIPQGILSTLETCSYWGLNTEPTF